MNFIDKVEITIKAGDGGNGALSFRREKFINRGGPDGGDGGDGGDVVFVSSRNENTLVSFRHNPKIEAERGEAGSKRRKHGKRGEDKIVKVPVGTVVSDESGEILADFNKDDAQVIIAKGGKGGFGNAHFVSSTRQAPQFAEVGEKTAPMKLSLELKMIADVGLVGLPNAGKSTLLSKISNARPAIADYPFTTLIPNLGVVDIDNESILLADIPGLIEGASEGKGLGHQFLRHIERTLVLVHLIDIYNEDVTKAYKTIQNELKLYNVNLSKRPVIIVLNKIDGVDETLVSKKINELKKVVNKSSEVLAISAASSQGLKDFLRALKLLVLRERSRQSKVLQKLEKQKPIITLDDESNAWTVSKTKQGYLIAGQKIEQFASRTDFSNEQSIQRLKDIMRRTGVTHALDRRGAKLGDKIIISKYGDFDY